MAEETKREINLRRRAHMHLDRSFGERLADGVAAGMGCWKFIIIQTVVVICWMTLNLIGWSLHWDEYPFILLNLLFSTQAAYAAPIIMMSQNRQAATDRIRDNRDDSEIGEILEINRAQKDHDEWTQKELSKQSNLLLELAKKYGVAG